MQENDSRKHHYWLITYCSVAIATGTVVVCFMLDIVFNGGQLFHN